MPLTVPELKNAQPRSKAYKLADGDGLYVLITPQGSRLFRYDYRFGGKRKTLSFGRFPDISLAGARERRDRAKMTLRDGFDPAGAPGISVTTSGDRPVIDPFETVARAWFAARLPGWVRSYSDRIMRRLEGDIFPEIGHLPIAEIEPPELLAAIRKIEDRGAVELAKRVKNYCGEVFAFGIAEGKCNRNPAADLARALKTPLPKKRRAWIRLNDMPAFMQKLRAFPGETMTQEALHLTVLTVVRTNEMRFADKREFEDLDGPEPLWRIPGHRMKIKGVTEHLVPLSRQATEIVRRIIDRGRPGNLLFPSPVSRDGTMSHNTMIYAMYAMGYLSKATVHGFRTTFSTAANEARRGDMRMWDFDAIERQLAHVEQNEVRASYNAAEYIAERRRLMQWWADQIDPANEFEAWLS